MTPADRPIVFDRIERRSDDEIVALPVDWLALEVLKQFDAGGHEIHVYNYLNAWRNSGLDGNGGAMRAIAEACEWLRHAGLIAEPSGIGKGFITRLKHETLDRELPFLGALEKLGRNLHPSIESVRSQFLLGEHELGAFAAMRQVEVRVRELGGYSNADIGYKLMRAAFSPNEGPLHDPSAESGEQQGLSDLFAGAIGVFKNSTSHRIVTFDVPAEAAEVISLASLLLRILDRSTSADTVHA